MVLVDEDHLGPLANLASWITIAVAVILGVAKIFTKWRIASELYADDAYMALSIIFAIGTTICTNFQVKYGLGQRQDTLEPDVVEGLLKAVLATDILYVVTIFSAKLSLIRFLRNFTFDGRRRKGIDVFLYVMMIWPMIAIIYVALRCPVPNTWDILSDRCTNIDAFWTVNTVLDVLSQTIIAFLPIGLLYDVHIAWAKKKLGIFSYIPVISTIPFEMLRIVSIWEARGSPDLSHSLYHPTLYTVIHANFSVIASTSTFLIPIVEALSVGLISSEVVLHPKLENSHVRRAEPPFNPMAMLGGRRFFASTHISSGNSTSRQGSSAHGGFGESRASKRKTLVDGLLGRSVDYHDDTVLGEEEGLDDLCVPGDEITAPSTQPIVIETTTTLEVRSDSESTVKNNGDTAGTKV